MADSEVDVRESSFTTFPAAEMEGENKNYICARATAHATTLICVVFDMINKVQLR